MLPIRYVEIRLELYKRMIEAARQFCRFFPRDREQRASSGAITCTISRVAQISGEGVRLVISLPLRAAAVVVVREDLVIVNVTTGQQRAPARTTHGSGHVCVPQLGTLVPYSP